MNNILKNNQKFYKKYNSLQKKYFKFSEKARNFLEASAWLSSDKKTTPPEIVLSARLKGSDEARLKAAEFLKKAIFVQKEIHNLFGEFHATIFES
jgi:hypothetical protein